MFAHTGVPSMGKTRRCKSSGEAGRSDLERPARCRAVRPELKEAVSESASRRTETGYKAQPTGASGPVTAKLPRPKVRLRRSGDCAVKVESLTWGDLALCLKRRRVHEGPEREVSRGRSSQSRSWQGRPSAAESRKSLALVKDQTEGRANRP